MPLGDTTYIPLDPTLFNDNDELSKLKSYVLRKLGWPLIRVEITEDQLMDCILDAVTTYHDYAAMDYDVIEVSVTGNQVQIPDTINPKFIVDVIFKRDYFDSLSAGLGAIGYEATLGGVLPYDSSGRSPLVDNFDITSYYLYMQHMEDFRKLVGIKKHFEILGGVIHLFPASISHGHVGILYKPMMNEQLAESSMWIKKYSVAGAKVVVGTIRSKLGAFSSTGANIAVDGEALKSEGREDLAKLEETIMTQGIPMPIMQG